MQRSLLVIQHQATCPPAWVGDWLRAAGVALDVRRANEGANVPSHLTEHDGLVVLGGQMSAWDDEQSPWLPAVRDLIAATVQQEKPFWGICLGHQLACLALGGSVALNPAGQREGLTPWAPMPDAEGDPLLGGLGPRAMAVHSNNDIVTELPDGAVRLASAPDGSVQAAKLGANAWGVQFHPEAGADVFGVWARDAAAKPESTVSLESAEAAIERVRAAEDLLQQTWRPVTERFAALL